ncbi:MAG: alkane 1-monooxygenase [Rubrivivax sp.]|nr:alkane 1-monooxygenase [Rubrivivax sp.]
MTPQALSNTPSAWRDRKRWLWPLSCLMPWLVLTHLWQFAQGGSAAWLWILPLWIHLIIPALDTWIGDDASNPPETAVPALEADGWYRWLVVAYVPGQWLCTVAGAALAGTQDLGLWAFAGLLLSVGGINGVGINTAHELGHKRVAWEQWLSKLTLAPVAYGHFFVEHNRGHHARVATPADPASARLGESFWAFLPRTVLGSLRSAWALEALRLRHAGHGPWHWRNHNLQAWTMTLLLYAALTALWGPAALLFLALQAVYGISLLEVVNYIEHYGLLRTTGADGKPVRCTPQHSWNSSHVVSNLFLFHLQRHSDHHAHPARRYQALRHFDDSPQLPSGYAAMLMVAYVPAWWRRVMDPRVLQHYGGDVRLAHLHPPCRDALLARYGR